MARFNLERDMQFFKGISSELVDSVIETIVVLYKLSISESKTNLYGESLSKTYYQGVNCPALIDRNETEAKYEGFGADRVQLVNFMFNRYTLEEKNFYPEIGDVIWHNNAYFEINNVREDQLVGGQVGNNFSIVCTGYMTRLSSLQLE
jgi:hypothetical protein